MAEKLQLKHLLTIFFTAVICCSVAQYSYAQVPLTTTESFEVFFVADETRSTQTTREIGMNDLDLNSILGEEGSNVSSFTNQADLQTGYYFVDVDNSVSIGSYYHTKDSAELVSLTLKNDTDKSISELSVAFDFIYIPVEQEQNFQLAYRVNNGKWKQPAGGTFSTDYLQSTVEGWNPFSIQITLDELFIRNDDTFEFRWTTSLDDTDEFLPIALQRIALNSTETSQQDIKPGSLVISEILAGYEEQGRAIEYVELFNTTEDAISLKGMTLKSGDREIVIQENIVVAPYDVVVLGNNRNFTDIPVQFNYQYNGSLLPNRRGRLDILSGDVTVAGAMYESTEPGVSLEMSHLSNGRNGYSSMSSFEESVTEISPSVFGSPGKVDESKRMYQKTISDEGWHFIYPLGNLREPDRNMRSSMYGVAEDLELSNSGNSDLLTTESFFLHVNKDVPVTLYSDGSSTPSAQPKSDQENPFLFKLLGNPLSNSIGVDQVVTNNNSQAFPAVMVWEPSTQKFNVLFKDEDFIDPWSGMILPESEEEVAFLENRDESKSSFLTSYISLSLLEEGDRNSFHQVDNGAVIGFAENRNILDDVKTDLPKLKLEDDEGTDQSFVYLRSSASEFETNSFLQFPNQFEEPYQIGVGVNTVRGNHNYRIAWNSMANVPEEWVIELVDVDADQVIDMREESHYTFRSQNISVEDGMNVDGTFLKTVENNSSKNLFIRVSPHTMVEESTVETEQPESVNLKQNYPNPFNPSTTISFYLPENSFVRLAIYNVVGQQVAMLREENISGGDHSVTWNASDMPSGIYIVKLETQQNVLTRKITLIK
ncbi:MAG: T9SS type A sorting domain-containing protein [Balneolaceae bacterium]